MLLERRGYAWAFWYKSFAHEADGSVERAVGEAMERRHAARVELLRLVGVDGDADAPRLRVGANGCSMMEIARSGDVES